jgi:hypothetical protein
MMLGIFVWPVPVGGKLQLGSEFQFLQPTLQWHQVLLGEIIFHDLVPESLGFFPDEASAITSRKMSAPSSDRTTIVTVRAANLSSPASGAIAFPKSSMDSGPYPVASVGDETEVAPTVIAISSAAANVARTSSMDES